ncbi:ABC transporter permease [Paenibacillus vulneris]|uniref:Transport permease protein n=1 Tax=Paenibacillus vulneris TaxID=1133364 RepID=A0ABW3UG71_9BACL
MLNFPELKRNFKLIGELAKNDFKSKYLGSTLGVIWAFIPPTVSILIFWFVFQVGFKNMPVDDFPFILWLITGIIPWFFIQDSISNSINCFLENTHLVKKVVFKLSVLPIVKITSSLIIHLFFLCILIIMFYLYGYSFDLYWLQGIYYTISSIILIIGISLITSSIVVFLKDISQFINMVLQFGFWLTPIFWSLKMIPIEYHDLLTLNPFYYIINGYRESFIYKKWFWENPGLSFYYWSFTCIVLIIGIVLYKKLKPHFADVL